MCTFPPRHRPLHRRSRPAKSAGPWRRRFGRCTSRRQARIARSDQQVFRLVAAVAPACPNQDHERRRCRSACIALQSSNSDVDVVSTQRAGAHKPSLFSCPLSSGVSHLVSRFRRRYFQTRNAKHHLSSGPERPPGRGPRAGPLCGAEVGVALARYGFFARTVGGRKRPPLATAFGANSLTGDTFAARISTWSGLELTRPTRREGRSGSPATASTVASIRS